MEPRPGPVAGHDDNLFLSAQRESESLKERLLELYLLYSISRNFNVSLQTTGIFESTVDFLKNTLHIDQFCLMLLDRDSGELRVWNADEAAYDATRDLSFAPGEGVSGLVAQTGEAVLIQDVDCDERFLHYKGRLGDIGSFLSVPLLTQDDRVIGVLNIHKRTTHAFRENDKVFFGAVAQNLAHALERARLYEDAKNDSMIDDLTRLYNRRYLLDCAQRELIKARRQGLSFSLILIDVDHFKRFNDTHGHLFGDRVLARIAAAFRASVRQSDVVARYGGEEFVILLPATDHQGALRTAEKIRALIEHDLRMDETGQSGEGVTITAGVAGYPEDGICVDDMLAVADRRLYRGKQQGRNRVISLAEEPSPLVDDDDRRRHPRFRTALRVVRDAERIHSIDVRSGENQWSLCTLMDVSRTGFYSMVEFRPAAGAHYVCRAMVDPDLPVPDLFSVQVVRVRPMDGSRYLMGVRVLDEHETLWRRLYAALTVE